jgi:long-chain acyl-CoA synthetase
VALDTIPQRVMNQAKVRPYRPAYYVKKGGVWRPTTWKDYVAEIRTAARALISLGFAPGNKVAILGFNRPEWVIFNVAAMSAGGSSAGIYTTCSSEEVQYIAHHAEATVILLEDEGQWQKIKARRNELPHLKHAVMFRGAPKIDDPMVMSWEAFMAKATATDAELDKRIDAIKQDELATLIYTSGTTGPPKGVMLSHRNLAWTAGCTQEMVPTSDRDCLVSYLPLSHIAEQMMTIHVPSTTGASIYYAESIDKVPDNLKEVQPTVIFGVPRIWEKFYAGVSAKLALAEGAKKYLVHWTRWVATEVNKLRNQGKEVPPWLLAQYKIVDKLVLSKLKPALGLGRARVCISGAAPIAREILEFFESLDVMLHEVYGQSEDTGPTSFNLPGATKLGTVGRPVPGVQVKIAEDGEILVKGPNVFLGYYKEPQATAECLKDGWLYSGDLGELDKDGFLCITGRKKEIIITAGGKNIAPKNIEGALKNHELINEAVVIGDRRKFLSALVTLDPEATARFMASKHLSGPAHACDAIRSQIQQAIDDVNNGLARVEQVKKFTILARNLTIEHGELTPTLKVKRKMVNQNFSNEIEAMYVD